MTTAIATQPPSAPIPWFQPRNIQEALDLSQDIAKSGLAPSSYNSDANKIFVAMVHGAELGLNAMQALQGIAVINGRPAVWGTLRTALVDRAGMVKRRMFGTLPLVACQKIRTGTWKGKTDANAVLVDALAVRIVDRLEQLEADKAKVGAEYQCGFAVVQVGDDIHVQLFDTVNAHKANLIGKKGPWQEYPERMLRHRAVTYLLRDVCSAALTGLAGQPTAEEVYDMEGTIETTAQEVVRRADPEAKAAEMATAQAGAPAPAPSAPQADRKAEVNARLRGALDRLKTIDGIDGKALVKDKVRELFGSDLAMTALTVDQRDTLAAAIGQVEAPPPADDAGEQAPSFDDADPDNKLNF